MKSSATKPQHAATVSPTEPVEAGKGGEGGDFQITNAEFIAAVFTDLPEGAFAAVCSKSGDPSLGGWLASRADQAANSLAAENNNYVSCSSFYPGDDGSFEARKAQFAPNALGSSPAVSGDACEILVPAELRTKNRFAAIKQTVSHSEQGCRCGQHSLVVDRVVDGVDRVTHRIPAQDQIQTTWKTKTRGSKRQTWRWRPKRTVASWGITGSELNRLSGAVSFMKLHQSTLWWVTTDHNTSRPLIHNVWKRITRLQGESGLPQYSVAVFEGRGGIHAHIIFIGIPDIARRLKASKQFGDVIDVGRVNDPDGLVRRYLAKERTPQAGYRREDVFGGRLNGSHRLEGGGDRVRLSRQLERDASELGHIQPWQHSNAKRKPEGSRGRDNGRMR